MTFQGAPGLGCITTAFHITGQVTPWGRPHANSKHRLCSYKNTTKLSTGSWRTLRLVNWLTFIINFHVSTMKTLTVYFEGVCCLASGSVSEAHVAYVTSYCPMSCWDVFLSNINLLTCPSWEAKVPLVARKISWIKMAGHKRHVWHNRFAFYTSQNNIQSPEVSDKVWVGPDHSTVNRAASNIYRYLGLYTHSTPVRCDLSTEKKYVGKVAELYKELARRAKEDAAWWVKFLNGVITFWTIGGFPQRIIIEGMETCLQFLKTISSILGQSPIHPNRHSRALLVYRPRRFLVATPLRANLRLLLLLPLHRPHTYFVCGRSPELTWCNFLSSQFKLWLSRGIQD